MKLTIFERLILLNILQTVEGDFTTIKIMRQLQEELSFTEEEHKKLQFKQKKGQVFWKTEAAKDKDITIGEKAKDIIVNTLKKLNDQKKLKDEHFTLYEKFIIIPEKESK
ncbi:unnamed protein product [marine sediment metagenome]|uniref:Uncharacterized protein n=1 Tax=marine sediment metagenome TaxID=412755 RepID=X1BGJ6_9ZZZZ